MDKYIISGLGPSQGGVGRLVGELLDYAQQNQPDIETIYIYAQKNPLFKFLKESFLGEFLKSVYYKLFAQNGIKLKLVNIHNSKVLLVHPQTIGFSNIYKLYHNNNQISIYVMDCSFFCVRSYNHLKGYQACLKCVGSDDFEPAIVNNCKPFPVKYTVNDNIEFLKFLKKNHQHINFLVQNKSQENLVKEHFGHTCQTIVVGMHTNEELLQHSFETENKDACPIVYHGSLDEPKGIKYVLSIAQYLKPYRVLVPYSYDQVTAKLGEANWPDNIVFKELTWETGLQRCVTEAHIVLNPSLWSAPIEGAMLKSISYNGCVAALNTNYSLAAELIADQVIISLDQDMEASAKKIVAILQSKTETSLYATNSKKWLAGYVAQKDANQKKLFNVFYN